MYFVGLDVAWPEANQTGVAVLDEDGRLAQVGAAVSDDEITATVAPYVEGRCVVAIDAPSSSTMPAATASARP